MANNQSDWGQQTSIEEQTAGRFFETIKLVFWDVLAFERRAVVTAMIAQVVMSLLVFSTPYTFKLVLDYFQSLGQGTTFDVYTMTLLLALFIGATVGQLTYRWFALEPLLVIPIIRLENYLPVLAQQKLLEQSMLYHSLENTGKQVAKVNKAVEKLIGILIEGSFHMVPAVLFIVLNIAIVLVMDWRFAIAFLITLPIALLVNIYAYKKCYPLWDEWEEHKEISNGFFVQSILSIATVQGYVQETREASQLNIVRDRMKDVDIDVTMKIRFFHFASGMILNLAVVANFILGTWLFLDGSVQLGTLAYVFFTGSATSAYMWEFVHGYTRVLKDSVAVERLHKLFGENQVIPQSEGALTPQAHRGEFVFDNVSFTYPGKEAAVLKGLNLTIKPGEMVALVGRSGSGKSTTSELLKRTYDPSEGALLLDGVDVREINRDYYRRLFAPVSQDVEIFDMSLKENIAYGRPDAPDGVIMRALYAAHLGSVLEETDKFPQGIETEVGERGVRLSGGEKQRVGIARAYVSLLMGAKVLVLDEATSSLDSESERAVQEFIERLRRDIPVTIVVIAHRLSTIRKADTICVMDSGSILEKGDHDKLLKRNGLYARLVQLQSLGEIRE